MTLKSRLVKGCSALAAYLIASLPAVAHAQSLPYGDVAGSGDDVDSGDGDGDEGGSASPKLAVRGKKVRVTPYIEALQVVTAELSPGNEVLTYTALAAGVEANMAGRNSQAAVSLRYERRFGYGPNTVSDSDVITGVARGSVGISARALTLEAGAMAARMSVENNGSTLSGREDNSTSQVYGAHIGPSLRTQLGALQVEGHYRFGYSRVESPDRLVVAPGQAQVDIYNEGRVHDAVLHAGFKAGTFLPIGLGIGAGWNREDVSNLDQRIDNKLLRGDVTLPIGPHLALVGGAGYEDIKVSNRDAVIDTVTGLPVVGTDGRYVTEKTQPRQIAYEAEGLIWDAGVIWRPSGRTALEAHVGRRYGSTTYNGSFAYAPNSRMSFNVSAYDSISGFGGMLNSQLAGLPTQFDAFRNPLSGDLGTCVAASGSLAQGQGTCLNGALASVNSAVFRGRGVNATLGINGGNLRYGIGAGYDRRKFIAAPGTVLAVANGVIDENYWVAAYLNGRIDRNSSFGTAVRANWYQSGAALAGNSHAVGATAAYYRSITSRLSATAAVGVDGVDRELLGDVWSAQAMVGIRYSF